MISRRTADDLGLLQVWRKDRGCQERNSFPNKLRARDARPWPMDEGATSYPCWGDDGRLRGGMASNQLTLLLQRPTESLNVEVKTWLDPATPEGVAKIVKGVFALRNRNGGSFVVGFDNDSLLPDPCSLQGEVAAVYHSDAVQALISLYANAPFEVGVELVPVGAAFHPVIIVPAGVRVPVVVKRDLALGPGAKRPEKNLLSKGDLYFRTLGANGTPSSSVIGPNDYSDLLEICFENREADIGRFLRRHLGRTEHTAVLDAMLPGQEQPSPTLQSRCRALIMRGDAAAAAAFAAAAAARPDAVPPEWLPSDPLVLAVALCLDPQKPEALPTNDFLRSVYGGNPNYTARPMWRDTRSQQNQNAWPKVKGDAWEAINVNFGVFPHSEFSLLAPTGNFFLRRIMQDDLRPSMVAPGSCMDEKLMTLRVAEVFAVGLAMAKSFGWALDGTAGFVFRWSGLAGRSLGAWANTMLWDIGGSGTAHDAAAESFVELLLDTPLTALEPYVSRAVGPLFSKFDGYEAPQMLVESCVRMLVERKIQ